MHKCLDCFRIFYARKVELKPGMKQVLDYLHEKKIPMAIVTSGSAEMDILAFERLQILDDLLSS